MPKASAVEEAVFGACVVDEIRARLDSYLTDRLGAGIAEVVLRSGRIDAVWGVRLDDGRQVVVKAHRPPVDLGMRAATVTAQQALVAAVFPCPEPLSGPDEVQELVLSVESMAPPGEPVDGRDPVIRRALAAGLHDQIEILRRVPGLADRAGPGSAWCRYQQGPWPVPHDTVFDFSRTPPAFRWLDELARAAAGQILEAREGDEVVVGHDDWYGGNTRFVDGRLVGSFDWQLVADTEPVVAGITSAAYGSSPVGGDGLSAPVEVAAFLRDHDDARSRPFGARQQRAAVAAAAWTLAYNARCALSFLDGAPGEGSSLALLREHGQEYLDLRW